MVRLWGGLLASPESMPAGRASSTSCTAADVNDVAQADAELVDGTGLVTAGGCSPHRSRRDNPVNAADPASDIRCSWAAMPVGSTQP